MSKSQARRAVRAAVLTQAQRMLGRPRRRPAVPPEPHLSLDALEQRLMMSRVKGVDVSQWQGPITWGSVHSAGYDFAFVRASAGNNTVDTRVAANMTGSAAAGLLVGAYHRAMPDASPNDAVNEANLFLSVAGKYMTGGWLRPVLAVYDGGGLGKTGLSQWVNTFERTVKNATGLDPVVYTTTSYATNYLDASVTSHDLWIADWSGAPDAALTTGEPPTGPWAGGTWGFWNYSGSGIVSGITGPVDLDAFNGPDVATLRAEFAVPAQAFQASLNFGPYEADVPPGYVNVADEPYGTRNGYTLGWSAPGAAPGTLAANPGPDPRYNTYVKPAASGVARSFEVAVPNGTYRVRVVASGPDGTAAWGYDLDVQGQSVSGTAAASGPRFLSQVLTVNVTDGTLTLAGVASSPDTQLAFVDIVDAARTNVAPAAPAAVTAVPASSTAVDVHWTDLADNEGQDPSTFASGTWAQVNQGYKVERQDRTGTTWSSWAVRGHARAGAESYQDTGLTPGAGYRYRVSAVKASSASVAVEADPVTTPSTDGQQPYNSSGTPWAVPGTIQAEDYDRGGELAGYHDTSAGNAGGFYRAGGADVARLGDAAPGSALLPRQYALGWLRPGEWTAYTVNVPAAGSYTLSFRVAADGAGGKFHASTIQGGPETNLAALAPGGQWDVPDTGSWDTYQTVNQLVELSAGVQTIRVYADQAAAGSPTVMGLDSLTFGLPTGVYGTDAVDQGKAYTLTLPTDLGLDGGDITGWAIDWGDGSDPDGDGAVGEFIRTNAARATHVYLADPGQYAVTAKVLFNGGEYRCAPLTVTVRPALIVTGPDKATAGDPLRYALAGPGADQAFWIVTRDGTPYLNGAGSTLSFVPDQSGTFVVEAYARTAAGQNLSVSTSLSVAGAPPQVTISGPAVAFKGRPLAFSSAVARPAGVTGSLTYAWQVFKSNGQAVTGASGTLSTYLTPSDLDPFQSPYTISLTVDDGNGHSTTATRKFQVLKDPSEADYQKGFVPVGLSQTQDSTRDQAYVVAQQTDGKILVAGMGWNFSGNTSEPGYKTQAFVARFNTDLTIDTTFGNGGVVDNALGLTPGQFTSSTVTAIAFDPATQKIVIAGTMRQNSFDGITVARLTQTGDQDDTFNRYQKLSPGMGQWDHATGSWENPVSSPGWTGLPYDIEILPDKHILVAGSQTKYWKGDGWNGTYHQDDFMLFRLTADGMLDTKGFGYQGYAASINPMGLPHGSTWDEVTDADGVPPGSDAWHDYDLGAGAVGKGAAITQILPEFFTTGPQTGQLKDILVGGNALDWANRSDTDYVGAQGTGIDFVLARFSPSGAVDMSFGPDDTGMVRTNFGTYDVGAPWDGAGTDDYLLGFEVLKSGDHAGDIVAVGQTVNPNVLVNFYHQSSYTTIPITAAALAWFTSDGALDTDFGVAADTYSQSWEVNYFGPVHQRVNGPFAGASAPDPDGGNTGKIVTTTEIGSNNVAAHVASQGAVTFDGDGKVVISTTLTKLWEGSGNYGGEQKGWGLTRLNVNGYEDGTQVTAGGTVDTTFGSVGDGQVVFSQPDPFPVSPATSDLKWTGEMWAMDDLGAVIHTDKGIVAVGHILLTGMPRTQGYTNAETTMLVRYKSVVPTPTDLVAAGLGQHAIGLTWRAPSEGVAFAYQVLRSPSGTDGSYQPIGYTGSGTTSFIDEDPTLEPGKTYFYTVHAVDGRGTMPTFAGPAQGATLPDLSNYGLIDRVVVPTNGVTVRSGATLVSGVKYIVRASGRLLATGPDGHQYVVDAEYVNDTSTHRATDGQTFPSTPSIGDTSQPPTSTVDVGMAINGRGQVRLVRDSYVVDEDKGTVSFTVVRTGGLVGDLQFWYDTTDGTAVAGVNYTGLTNQTATLHDGVSVAVISVDILHDSGYGQTKQFTLNLRATSGGAPISQAKVEIADVDAPVTFSIEQPDYQVLAGQTAYVVVTAIGRSAGTAQVKLNFSAGTTPPGFNLPSLLPSLDPASDTFDSATGTLTHTFRFKPASTPDDLPQWTVPIVTQANAQLTSDATFFVHIAPVGAVDKVAPRRQATVTVHPAGTANTFRISDAGDCGCVNVSDENLVLTVFRDTSAGDAVQLNWSVGAPGDTAKLGKDYKLRETTGTLDFGPGTTQQTLTVPLVHRLDWAPDTTLTVTVTDAGGTAISNSPAAVTIHNNNPAPVVGFGSPAYTVAQSADGVDLVVWRGANQHGRIDLNYTITPGDYGAPSSTTIPDGQSSAKIRIPLSSGSLVDPTASFTVALTSAAGGTLGAAAPYYAETTVTVVKNTAPAAVQFEAPSYGTLEGNKTLFLHVVRTGDATQALSVPYATVAGTAVAGTNFVAKSGTLDFAAGARALTIPITIADDGTPSADKAFTVQLATPTVVSGPTTPAPALGTNPTATVTVQNVNDYAQIGFATCSFSGTQTSGVVHVTVRRYGNTSIAAVVGYATGATGDSAVAGTDYTATSGTLTFAPGEDTKTLDIPVVNEHAAGPDRTFTVLLSGFSATAKPGTYTQAEAKIINDNINATTVGFPSPGYVAVKGTAAQLTIVRHNATDTYSTSLRVHWRTQPGTAAPGTDYGVPPGGASSEPVYEGIATFAPGDTSVTLSIPIGTSDPNAVGKFFTVSLGTPQLIGAGPTDFAILGYNPQATVSIVGVDNPVSQGAMVHLAGRSLTDHAGSSSLAVVRTGSTTSSVTVQWVASTYVRNNPSGIHVMWYRPWTMQAFASGTVTIPAGATDATFNVAPGPSLFSLQPGAVLPPDTLVHVTLLNPNGAGLGDPSSVAYGRPIQVFPITQTPSSYIVSPGFSPAAASMAAASTPASTIGFEGSVYLVNKAAGTVTFTVLRGGDTSQAALVDYVAQPGGSAHPAESTGAKPDFVPVSGTLSFKPGETRKTIAVDILPNDKADTGDLTFTLDLTPNAGNQATDLQLSPAQATVIISQLTDPRKGPSWGPPSTASDNAYTTVVDGSLADASGHLVLSFRNGEYTNATVDGDQKLVAEIYAPLPHAISQLVATPHWDGALNHTVSLTWKSPRDAASDDWYLIERSEDGGQTFTFVASVAPGTTSYVDRTVGTHHVDENVPYQYRIVAHAGTLDSNPSNIAYALVMNHAPRVEDIGTQLLTVGATGFQYSVVASDVEDGKTLTYAISVTDVDGNTLNNVLSIDANGLVTQAPGWSPTAADVNKAYKVTVTVTDQNNVSTPTTFSLAIANRRLDPPTVGQISSALSADGTSATLHIGGSGLNYRWHFVRSATGPEATIVDPTVQNPTILFTRAGTYQVAVRVTRPDDLLASAVVVNTTITVAQQATSMVVDPYDDYTINPDTNPNNQFSLTLPADTKPAVVGTAQQYFVATVYDQFGNLMAGGSDHSSGPHPDVYWALYNEADGSQIGYTEYGYQVPFSAADVTSGIYKLVASNQYIDPEYPDYLDPEQPLLQASIRISFTELDRPLVTDVNVLPNAATSRQLHAVIDTSYAGNQQDLQYFWTATEPGVVFSDNGASAARDTVVTFSKAGTYHVQLTVKDPHNLLESVTPFPVDDITLASTPTAIRVTPGRPSVPANGSQILAVTEVDQFGTPTELQPDNVTWTITGIGALISPHEPPLDHIEPNDTFPAGVKAQYFPQAPADTVPGSFLARLTATVPGFDTVEIPINLGNLAPLTVTLSVDTTPDTLGGAGGADYASADGLSIGGSRNFPGAANLVDRPQPIRAVIDDPNDDATITWTLTATRLGDANDHGTTILTGTGRAGTRLGALTRIGTLLPSQLPDGTYTLTLTATADANGTLVTGRSQQVVQVRSAVKLGNLTLPVTDLTQNVPNNPPITVSRSYDSQRAGQDVGLGFGWTLDALTPSLTTTATVQYDGQPDKGTGGTSLAWSDLVYVTLPSGEEHVFAFRPIPLINMAQPGAGLVMGVATYKPNFVPVDGTGTTLQPCESDGTVRTDTLQWDSGNGYMFKSLDNGLGYNPALEDEFGGYYFLTTVDGTRYVVNATTGKLHAQVDLQGTTRTFDDTKDNDAGGSVSTTLNHRRYYTEPTKVGNHITQILTRAVDDTPGATPVTLQRVDYGYDADGNLTSVTVKDPATGATLQSTQYTYDADHRLTGVIDGQGLQVLTAAYSPTTGQLTQLRNIKGTAANANNGYDGTDPNQTTTDPSGNQTTNEFDDHGNVTRQVRAVTDPSGKQVLYYVVTVTDIGYASPDATDNQDRPMVNVLAHRYTSSPFVVPVTRANDRFLSVPALKTRGYLKTDANGEVLWANIENYDTNTRTLYETKVLQPDGRYSRTVYFNYYHGQPKNLELHNGRGDFTVSTNTYNDGTLVNPDGRPNPNVGKLISSGNNAGVTTYYLYGGDPIPGTGDYDWNTGDWIEQQYAEAPVGALYATYQQTTSSGAPLYLTRNLYYTAADVAAHVPGAVPDMLKSTTDYNADPLFGMTNAPLTGVTTTYTYTPAGQVATVTKSWTDANGNPHSALQSSSTYDALGRVLTSTDASGNTTTTTNDANGQVLDTTDAYGGITHNVYDATGHPIQTLYPDGTETRTVYDRQGRVLWQSDRYASSSSYNPATGDVTSDNSTPANATLTVYDQAGNAVGTERHADVQITITPDDTVTATRPVQQSLLASDGTLVSHTSTTYDSLGRVVQTTDATGVRTGTIYDAQGNVLYTGILRDAVSDKGTSPWYTDVTPNPTPAQLSALFVSYTPNTVHVWDLGYGPTPPFNAYLIGGLYDYDLSTDALGHYTRTYSDFYDRRTETLYPDGSYSATYRNDPRNVGQLLGAPDNWDSGRDGSWDLTSDPGWPWLDPEYGSPYFPTGYSEVVQVAQRRGNSADPVLATVYIYDAAGRLVDVWLPYVTDADPNSPTYDTRVRPHWHYTYDANGNQLTQTDPNGHATTFEYDCKGQRTSRSLPAVGGSTVTDHWTYDDFGRTLTHKDFNGQTTAYVYDNSPAHGGRLLAEFRFATGATAPTFDTDGSLTDASEQAATEKTDYTYDSLGRQASATDSHHTPGTSGGWAADTSTTTTYDPITGQAASVETKVGPSLDSLGPIHYTYNPTTGQKTETSTTHNDTHYVYDTLGRLWKVHVTLLNDQPVDQTTTYTYDALGNLQTVTQPNGLTTTYTYDTLNRLDLEEVRNASNTLVASYDYHVRPDGLRDWVVEYQKETNGTFSTTKVSYDYDPNGRLITETRDVGNDGPDPADQKTTYAFDLNGNRTSKAIDAGNDGTADDVLAYTYNGRDQLTAEGPDTDADGLPDPSTDTTYAYDNNGSTTTTTTPTGTTKYAWDLRNRMVGLDANGDGDLTDPGDTTYTYDTNGVRTGQSTVGGPTTYYVNDPQNPTGYTKAIEEKSTPTGTPSRSYVLGLSVEAQSDGANDILYLLADGHGTARAVVDFSGVVAQRYDFDAYGKAIGFDPALALTRWLQSDGIYDVPTGSNYNLSRFLHNGRWLSRDSVIFAPGDFDNANLYGYVGNNPVMGWDPSGHDLNLISQLGVVFGAAKVAEIESGDIHNRVAPGAAAAKTGVTVAQTYEFLMGLTVLGMAYFGSQDTAQFNTNPQPMSQVRKVAVDNAVQSGKHTQTEAERLPVFFVYKTGPGATPQIWDNDALAMQGKQTLAGVPAPDDLFYIPGIRILNRPAALSWAASANIKANPPTTSLDEYPFASTLEGGRKPWLRVEAVPVSEQQEQAKRLRSFYAAYGPKPFEFLVALVP